MSVCHRAVVGVLLVHQGRIAVAHRQRPPLNLAPSAGHVELESGVKEEWRTAAAREVTEETGVRVTEDQLSLLLYYSAEDDCAKIGADGEPGGRHEWRVFLAEIKTVSRPTLRDEPGKMHGWEWRSIDSLLADEELEPIWRTLLTVIKGLPKAKVLA